MFKFLAIQNQALNTMILGILLVGLLLVTRQGVSGYIDPVKDTTYTLPISYSSFFIPVTGFGEAQQAWYPDSAALTVRKVRFNLNWSFVSFRLLRVCNNYWHIDRVENTSQKNILQEVV